MLCNWQKSTTRAQRVVHYPAMSCNSVVTEELKAQVKHLSAYYHIVELIVGVSPRKGENELVGYWFRYQQEDRT